MSTLSGFKSSFYCSHQRSPTEQEIFNEGVREGACRIVEMSSGLKPIALTDDEKTKILDWVSACQSAYHTDNTPGRWFDGLGSNLDENRAALIEFVGSIIESRSQTAAPQHSADIDAMRAHLTASSRDTWIHLSGRPMIEGSLAHAFAVWLIDAAIDAALQAKGESNESI